MAGQLLLLSFDVVPEHFDLRKLLDHFGRRELDAVDVNVDRALDAPPAGFAHASPVLERAGDQGIGRNGGDCLVPVLNFDCVEGDLDNAAVGAVIGHFNPVARTKHVMHDELDTGDETEDRVLENQ